MTEVLVQVRMPKKLLDDLKRIPSSSYYLDQSELIRSVIRNEWIRQSSPEFSEIKKLRIDIMDEIKQKGAEKLKHDMVSELEKIKKMIKGQELFK